MGAGRHSGFRKEGGIVQIAPAPGIGQGPIPDADTDRYRYTVERSWRARTARWKGELDDRTDPPASPRAAAAGPLGYVGALRIVDWPAGVEVGPGSDVEPVSLIDAVERMVRGRLEMTAEQSRERDEDLAALRDLYGPQTGFRLPY